MASTARAVSAPAALESQYLERSQSQRSFRERTFSSMEPGSIRGSVFSLCSSAIGSGVLLLPYTFAQVGPLAAMLCLAAAAFAGYVTLRICCAAMYVTQQNSYVSTLGKLWSSEKVVALLTCMLVVSCFGQTCGYFVFAAQVLQKLLNVWHAPDLLCKWGVVVTLIGLFPALPLSLWRNLSDFRYLTLVTVLGLSYLTLLVIFRMPYYVDFEALGSDWLWRVPNVWQVPLCWSLGFYAYVTHMNVFTSNKELFQREGSDDFAKSRRINKVINRSVLIETVLYVTVAIFGYLSFGEATPDNVMQAYDQADSLANIGRIFVFAQLTLGVPLTVHPGRTQLWSLYCLWSRGKSSNADPIPPLPVESTALQALDLASSFTSNTESNITEDTDMPMRVHVIISVVFVALTGLVAVLVPSASDLMGIVGGFSCVTYVCLLPAEMARKIRSEYPDKISSSAADFLAGSRGAIIIVFLWACTMFGYMAASQSAWRIMLHASKSSSLTSKATVIRAL